MEKDKQKSNQPYSNNPQPSKPRRWLSIILYTLAFAGLAYYFLGEPPTKGISYTKLNAYIEAGAVEKIEVSGDLQAQAKVQPQQYTLVLVAKEMASASKVCLIVKCLLWTNSLNT